eukprot:TRINITY_DN3192_c0_g1_i1.p1 TRINITY_DN3192_c0_g1~~TRINITY_DN3192_c0_g1_i1.p1  ORF type:complete len:434 (+),score=85.60 TRINITY_DN3192_c0_g1_i1:665-1966(+)
MSSSSPTQPTKRHTAGNGKASNGGGSPKSPSGGPAAFDRAAPVGTPKRYEKQLQQAGAGESKLGKVITRSVYGGLMILGFAGILYLGHLYVCVLVLLLQCVLFWELLNVRYKAEKAKQVPLFRTIQWLWFALTVYFTYGDELLQFVLQHRQHSVVSWLLRYHSWTAFAMYAGVFVLTTLNFKKDSYKYQVGQLTWTGFILCLTVVQMKLVIHNILNGLFWFVLPSALIICNDCMAYFAGVSLGRRLIHAPFLAISPNKTWEGFIGGCVLTLGFAAVLPLLLVKYTWLVCPPAELSFFAEPLQCDLHPVFLPTAYAVPSVVSSLLGLTSGSIVLLPVQLHSVILGVFASLVAPFGGFFASALKRAYRIKDFNNLIPGHGGVMDRMDCQFLMGLCTAVHYQTFIAVSVPAIMRAVAALSEEEKRELLARLQTMLQ